MAECGACRDGDHEECLNGAKCGDCRNPTAHEPPDPTPGLRTVIITWDVGCEPSIDATGVAGWELSALLQRCWEIVDGFRAHVESGAFRDDDEI